MDSGSLWSASVLVVRIQVTFSKGETTLETVVMAVTKEFSPPNQCPWAEGLLQNCYQERGMLGREWIGNTGHLTLLPLSFLLLFSMHFVTLTHTLFLPAFSSASLFLLLPTFGSAWYTLSLTATSRRRSAQDCMSQNFLFLSFSLPFI